MSEVPLNIQILIESIYQKKARFEKDENLYQEILNKLQDVQGRKATDKEKTYIQTVINSNGLPTVTVDNIRFIMQVGSSSTQTYDLFTGEPVPAGCHENVGSGTKSDIIKRIANEVLATENESWASKSPSNLLLVNSIGYGGFYDSYKAVGMSNDDDEPTPKGLNCDNINSVYVNYFPEADENNDSYRIKIVNRNCKPVYAFPVDATDKISRPDLGGAWADRGSELTNIIEDASSFYPTNLFDVLIAQSPNITNICDIGGSSATMYIKDSDGKWNKNEKILEAWNTDTTPTGGATTGANGKLVKGFNGTNREIDKDTIEARIQYYKNLIYEIRSHNPSKTIFIQTGKMREVFLKQSLTTLTDYKREMGIIDFNFFFLPHLVEVKYEQRSFYNNFFGSDPTHWKDRRISITIELDANNKPQITITPKLVPTDEDEHLCSKKGLVDIKWHRRPKHYILMKLYTYMDTKQLFSEDSELLQLFKEYTTYKRNNKKPPILFTEIQAIKIKKILISMLKEDKLWVHMDDNIKDICKSLKVGFKKVKEGQFSLTLNLKNSVKNVGMESFMLDKPTTVVTAIGGRRKRKSKKRKSKKRKSKKRKSKKRKSKKH
jgi:hypothetical protein